MVAAVLEKKLLLVAPTGFRIIISLFFFFQFIKFFSGHLFHSFFYCLVRFLFFLSLLQSSMFWMDSGREGRSTLERSWMDGSDRDSLAVLTAQQAHSLTADVAARRLYWISDVKKVRESH